MQYSVLGPTGVKVSQICLGTATFGVAPSVHDADRIVGTALDLGINYVDTADVYGNMPVFDRPPSGGGDGQMTSGTRTVFARPVPIHHWDARRTTLIPRTVVPASASR
jgi:Aldo/keto reductase family